jgi:hypothetical protein
MNVMNVANMWKSATCMPQGYENKGSVNVMNVVRKYFGDRARVLPIRGALAAFAPSEIPARQDAGVFNHQSPDHTIAQFLNSLLIPCFGILESQTPAIPATFYARPKKFPVLFPVNGELAGYHSRSVYLANCGSGMT